VIKHIIEQKQASNRLEELESLESSILAAILHAVIGLHERRIVFANNAVESVFGWKPEELIGKTTRILYRSEAEYETIGKYFYSALDRQQTYIEEFPCRHKDGRDIVCLMSASRIGEKLEEKKIVVIYENITGRRKAEERLERSFVELAETVSRAMKFRDPYTAEHQRKVAELARLVGEKMGLDKDRLMGLYIGGLLHDIGKCSTPESILSKPGKLIDEEWALVHVHAKQGYEILDGASFPWPVADMALHHHERLDGSGYPDGISGDELSLENRILGVCDVVESMSSFRPYRPARSIEEVLEEIKDGKGTKYDPAVVDIMLQIIEGGEFEIEKGRLKM